MTQEQMYDAVVARDAACDGRFFARAADARATGLRACKRCRPDDELDAIATRVARVRELIDAADVPPTLAELAVATGVSRSHLQRQFTRIVGVSPKRYADARRRERLRGALRRGGRVVDAIYDAGYGAPSRAYAQNDALGMTPQLFRAGGAGVTIRYAIVASPLGRVLAAATARGVCAVHIGDDDGALVAQLHGEFPRATLAREDDSLVSTTSVLVAYLAGTGSWPQLPLDMRGTAFQRRVWDALRGIAAGETRTYGELAAALGDRRAARAVGAACAANPIALLVPCHRVLPAKGAAGAYRWGAQRKRTLLALERST